MPVLKNAKQEIFVQNWVDGKTLEESAKLAKYSPKWAGSIASRLSRNVKVLARYKELQEKAASNKVMGVQERKERLSEIARARLTDFMELGKDGSWVNIGPETPNGGAISEIHSRTEYNEDTDISTVHTSVKLHNPVNAIQELNKMDKIYSDSTTVNATINNFNIDKAVISANERLENAINSLVKRIGETEVSKLPK